MIRGTPIEDFSVLLELKQNLLNRRRRFINSDNFIKVSFDNSEIRSWDSRIRVINNTMNSISLPHMYRLSTLGLLRLVGLISQVELMREVLLITILYDNIVVDYNISERIFVFIRLDNGSS
jgi:hypothetical protein